MKYFICAASSLCSSPYFSTQTSLPKLKTALAEILWILNVVYSYCYIRLKNIQLSETSRVTCSLEHGRTTEFALRLLYKNDLELPLITHPLHRPVQRQQEPKVHQHTLQYNVPVVTGLHLNNVAKETKQTPRVL